MLVLLKSIPFSPALAAFLVSFIVIPVAIFIAHRLELLAHPVERSSHTIPTPQVGGIGIGLGLAVAIVLSNRYGALLMPQMALLLALVSVGLLIGLYDDIRPLGAVSKLFALFLISALGAQAISVGPGMSGYSGWFRLLLFAAGFCWLFHFTNAFNFLDGANGFAGTFAILACAWMLVGRGAYLAEVKAVESVVISMYLPAALPLIVLLAAVAGFLPWNLARWRTFMGDSGSLVVGALLAVLATWVAGGSLIAFWGAVLVLSPFCYDMLFTLLRRFLRGENIFVAHRSHLYQRLLIATGWSHHQLLAFHILLWLSTGLAGAYVLAYPDIIPCAIATVYVIFILLFYTFIVIKSERKPDAKDA